MYFNEKAIKNSLPGQHKSVNWTSAKSTLDLIKHAYAKASIPMLSDDGIRKKILKLYDEYKTLNKIPEKRRSQVTVKKRVEDYQFRLHNTTLACWDPKAKLEKEDEEFPQNMKTQRTFTIGGLDTKRQKMIQRRNEKMKRQQEFRKRALQEAETIQKVVDHDDLLKEIGPTFSRNARFQRNTESDSSEIFAPEPLQEDITPRRKHRRTMKTGTEVFIPYDAVAGPGVVGYEVRTKSSATHTIGFLSTIIERFGGDKTKVNLSFSQAYRCRIATAEKYAEVVKEGWICPKPAAVHWDGKIMNDLESQYKQKDRLPILVSGHHTHKLLGVAALPTKSSKTAGKLISEEVMLLLDKWKCTNQIASMVFDTTATNTGHVTAACVSLQMKLGCPLFWSACRKHIGEVVMSHIWDDLNIEKSKSKDIIIFKHFREKGFAKTPHSYSDERVLTTQDVSKFGQFAISQTEAARNLIKNLHKAGAYERDDYKKCLDLMAAYLGDNHEYNFLKPGAIHKARWLEKQLYCYKIVLL